MIKCDPGIFGVENNFFSKIVGVYNNTIYMNIYICIYIYTYIYI